MLFFQSQKSVGKPISTEKFKELMETGKYTVIDIRTPREIAKGKITPDALEIDFYASNFTEELNKLKKDKKYLIYCRSGNRSKGALQEMEKLEFKEVYELDGGKLDWDKKFPKK